MAKLNPFHKKIIFLLGIVLIALIYSGLRFANSYKLKEGHTNHLLDPLDHANDHLTQLTETTDSTLEPTGLYLGDVQLMRNKTGTSLGQEIESSSSSSGERTAAGIEVGGSGV